MTAVTAAVNSARVRMPRVNDPLMTLVAVLCLVVVLFALLGPLLTAWSPTRPDPVSANLGPSATHWLGTDYLGRDLYTRAAYGARISLFGAGLVVVLTTAGAVLAALTAAWFGRWVDAVLGRAMDILFAFPSLLFALIAVSVFGVGLTAPVVALSVAYLPYLGRVMRTVATRERNLAYIDACSLAGIPTWRIWLRHLLPALLPYLRAQATIAFGYAISDLAAISFIGLGVQAPTADWGVMVAEGREPMLNHQPLEAIFAGVFIVVTVVAFNLLGERLSARAEAR